MAVTEVVSFEVKSGRRAEFVSLMREVKSNCERVDVGLKSFRLMDVMIGGPASGRIMLVAEYADLPSWGQSIEIEENDPAIEEVVRRALGTDPVATVVNRMVVTEIPL